LSDKLINAADEIHGRHSGPKKCSGCMQVKPLSEYSLYRRGGKLYYRTRCKACGVADAASWNQKNRDRVNARKRAAYNNDPGVIRRRSEREQRLAEERERLARYPETERTCRKCEQTKPIEEFSKGDGGNLRKVCNACKAEQHRQWRGRNSEHIQEWHRKYNQSPERQEAHRDRQRRRYHEKQEKETRYQRRLRRLYNLTQAEYDAKLAEQNGVCAVCGQECKSGRTLAVDHCHVTGEVRGLLCMNCNRAIGWLKDDPKLIQAALEYIVKWDAILQSNPPFN
jgi:hypothetical protein